MSKGFDVKGRSKSHCINRPCKDNSYKNEHDKKEFVYLFLYGGVFNSTVRLPAWR